LKRPNTTGTTSIIMHYSWGYRDSGGKYKPLKYATGVSVSPDRWDGENVTGTLSQQKNQTLKEVKTAADGIYIRLKDEGLTPELFKAELDIRLKRTGAPKEATPKKNYIDNYLAVYISEIETGARRTLRNPDKPFSKGTIRDLRAFRNKLKAYYPHLTFEQVDMTFYRAFLAALLKEHTTNTAGKFVKKLKTVMQAALDDGIHSNVVFRQKSFKAVDELVDTIYLTDKELDLIWDMDLEGPHETARDLFMLGVLTFQRVSDWWKFNRKTLRKTPKGLQVFAIQQQKTGTHVLIPYTSMRLTQLMEKYDYTPPVMSEQKINDYIKQVVEAAADLHNDEQLFDKAAQVSTHTARRSACSNAYYNNIPTGDIMKLSGHKTEAEFKKYIRVTDDEAAEKLATYEYFNR